MTAEEIEQLKQRVARLEESRYKTVGEMNALRTMLLSAWLTLIQRSSSSPQEILSQLQQAWLPKSPQAQKVFPGIDSSELAAFSQEYETSISRLLADLERALGQPK